MRSAQGDLGQVVHPVFGAIHEPFSIGDRVQTVIFEHSAFNKMRGEFSIEALFRIWLPLAGVAPGPEFTVGGLVENTPVSLQKFGVA
ncbi:MAG: hypothetical protein ACI86C_001911 [Candidatus Latescibacterota bacterium]|jgi:hypothetical protein